MLKICGTCAKEKELTNFYSKNRSINYPISSVSSDCKDCVKAKRKAYVKHRPDKCKTADIKQHLKRYNLTPEGYNSLFEKQKGQCLGCERHQSEFDRRLAVDHDHQTGKVRGLLCTTCNLILGYAMDDEYILNNLMNYLNLNSESAVSTDIGNNIIPFQRKSTG